MLKKILDILMRLVGLPTMAETIKQTPIPTTVVSNAASSLTPTESTLSPGVPAKTIAQFIKKPTLTNQSVGLAVPRRNRRPIPAIAVICSNHKTVKAPSHGGKMMTHRILQVIGGTAIVQRAKHPNSRPFKVILREPVTA